MSEDSFGAVCLMAGLAIGFAIGFAIGARVMEWTYVTERQRCADRNGGETCVWAPK